MKNTLPVNRYHLELFSLKGKSNSVCVCVNLSYQDSVISFTSFLFWGSSRKLCNGKLLTRVNNWNNPHGQIAGLRDPFKRCGTHQVFFLQKAQRLVKMLPVSSSGCWWSAGSCQAQFWQWGIWLKHPPWDLQFTPRGCLESSSGLPKVLEFNFNTVLHIKEFVALFFIPSSLSRIDGWLHVEEAAPHECVVKDTGRQLLNHLCAKLDRRNNLPPCRPLPPSCPRCPVQQLLPSVPPAPADAAGETPLPGSAAAQHSRCQFGAAGALLCGLPALWKICVGVALQWVRWNISGPSACVQKSVDRKILSGERERNGWKKRRIFAGLENHIFTFQWGWV